MWLKDRLWPAATELALAFTGLLAGWLVVGGAALLLAGLLPGLRGSAVLGLVAGPLITVVGAIVYGLTARTYSDFVGDEPAQQPSSRVSLRRTAAIVAVASFAAIAGSILIGFGLDAAGLPVEEQSAVTDIVQRARAGEGWRDAIVLSISAIAVAPAAEEFLFRALLFRRIGRRSGRGLAYVVSALAFAAIHANPAGFVIYGWLGVCFALALDRSGRIGAAIAVHVLNNAFVLANLLLA